MAESPTVYNMTTLPMSDWQTIPSEVVVPLNPVALQTVSVTVPGQYYGLEENVIDVVSRRTFERKGLRIEEMVLSAGGYLTLVWVREGFDRMKIATGQNNPCVSVRGIVGGNLAPAREAAASALFDFWGVK